ncbi:MAG: DUF84 family protein [Legionellaceae bacterium]|nr:DUF84 family protein [Legionellaceae bacterium]
MNIVVFSSIKDMKVKPVERALELIYPDGFISLRHRVGEHDTGIPSQPVGPEETQLGAEQRAIILREKKSALEEQLKDEHQIQASEDDTWLYVGVEGGLILNQAQQFSDVIYVAFTTDTGPVITRHADPVVLLDINKKPYKQDGTWPLHDDKLYSEMSETEQEERDLCIYGHQEGEAALEQHQPTYQGYRQQIVERILSKENMDLYTWSTKNLITREMAVEQAATRTVRHFLDNQTQNLEASLHEESDSKPDKSELAERLLELVAGYGCVASLGARYRDMVWMRDLSCMAPTLLEGGYFNHILTALRGFAERQGMSYEPYNDGYSTNQRYGKIPIVYVPKANTEHFLAIRISSWQHALWAYVEKNQPTDLKKFPMPLRDYDGLLPQDKLSLDGLNQDTLRQYYTKLMAFETQLQTNSSSAPKASFSLRRFMSQDLENLTPGTQDSEIHFIRAFMFLVDALDTQENKQELFDEFASALSGAIFYLYMNVIDPRDGLPFGADSRDIFADFMYDAKTLCNASYYYQVLSKLVEHAPLIKNTFFSQHMAEQLQPIAPEYQPAFLTLLASRQYIQQAFLAAKSELESSIRTKLLYDADTNLNPRDFIPGERVKDGILPVMPLPTYVVRLIDKQGPEFLQGKTVDPQGLALAVLSGLVDKKDYPQVISHFESCDSDIGIKVFTPISATSEHEVGVLLRNHGWVVWPNISYRVVQALNFMDTPESKHMAELQVQKLSYLPSINEWYAKNLEDNTVYVGGAPMQGWHAGGLLMPVPEINFEAVSTLTTPKTAHSYVSFFRKHPYVAAAGIVAAAGATAVVLNGMISSEEYESYSL